MLNHQTTEGLHHLKLDAMAAALVQQQASAAHQGLSFEERLGLLVDAELTERENRRLSRYLKSAKLRCGAVVEDIDFRRQRGVERSQVLNLAEGAWIRHHHQVAILGATGTGKTFLACALANAAIRAGHSALYLRFSRMLDELAIARLDGRFARLTAAWARVEVLVLDDFLLRPLQADQAADTLEVIEDRSGMRSTILTSQLPISQWHEAMGEPTVGEAILDRICQNLHRIELAGDSMRSRGPARSGEEQPAVTDSGEVRPGEAGSSRGAQSPSRRGDIK